MKWTEIKESDLAKQEAKDAKKSAKALKKKQKNHRNWTATVVEEAPDKKTLAKQAKAEADLLRIQSFASVKTLWKPYALLIGNYFKQSYKANFKYLYEKLKEINVKPQLTKTDIAQMQIIVSLNKLNYYVTEDDIHNTIDVKLDLIERDFFIKEFEDEYYQELIKESDQKFDYSISYLLKTYNLLISFVKEKELRQVLYKALVIDADKTKKNRRQPLVLTEEMIDKIPYHEYLLTDFRKREPIKHAN